MLPQFYDNKYFIHLQVAVGYLYHLSKAIVNTFDISEQDIEISLLKEITDPFTKLVIQVSLLCIVDVLRKLWRR